MAFQLIKIILSKNYGVNFMNYLDERFGRAFKILDHNQNELDKLSIQHKIEILQIVIKAQTEKLRIYEQELRYKKQIYTEFKKS